ncbi:MAG: 23S rRNA (guanosine(2251)-2'-O)-methyltransferase RlmB [Defluviitaleaceae bacterium]|nr:23S rRNA (guanosine(2251)-2'-O)-methyltransferase RlmB [Defluviitaleaceae bacterium]
MRGKSHEPGKSVRAAKPGRGKSAAFEKFGRADKVKQIKRPDAGKPDKADAGADENYCLIGRNAVLEAINHGKPVDKVLLRKDGVEGSLKMIAAKARERRIVVQEVDRARLELLAGGANHQGVVALCPPQEYAEVEDMFALADERGEAPFVIVLDGVTDPHNLGAIIRTADASGAHGVIIPKRRAAGITPIVTKASAGAVAHVLVARVPNLVTVIEDLKKRGLWIAAADFGAKAMYTRDLKGALAIVIGSEGEGVSRLVRQKCDFGVGVPMRGKLDSLNASVAAGVLMYEAVRQRTGDGAQV